MGIPLLITRSEALVGKLITTGGIVFGDGSVMTSGIESVPVVTSQVYVDYDRVDSYTENGTHEYPYKTLAAAKTKAESLNPASDSPIRIVIMSSNTIAQAETLTFTKGHVFIAGENSSGTHAPLIWYGALTFAATAGIISDNHFSIIGLEIIAITGTTAITFSGTFPQRLYFKDVWLTGNGPADAMRMTNTGSGSSTHIDDTKFSHNGTGHYHCLNVLAGTANVYSSETSGVLAGAFGVGGTLNLNFTEIVSGGDYAVDVYAGGTVAMATCKVTTTAANSYGIKLGEATAAAIIGNVLFNVPAAGTARCIYGVASTVLYYQYLSFYPGGNAKISIAISSTVIGVTPSFVA